MNLKKIGMYIAAKRKALGLTQVELAKQLGMSDKSVSKWERGVCLPDVSIYEQLCDILGISINEFIAGEDLDFAAIDVYARQSEKNLLDVATEAEEKYNKMQNWLICLAIIYFAISCWLVMVQTNPVVDYMEAIDKKSQEMVIAEAVYSGDSIFGYRYSIQNKYESINSKQWLRP